VLINNAGAMYGTRQLTKDGIEMTWAVNHLAPFLLSKLLIHRLKESAPARIIHHGIAGASGSPHPVRRSQRRALLSRLWPLLRNQAGQHPVHG